MRLRLLQPLNGLLVQGLYGEEAVRSQRVFECVLSAPQHRTNGRDATPNRAKKNPYHFKNEHKKIPQPVKAEGGGSRLRGETGRSLKKYPRTHHPHKEAQKCGRAQAVRSSCMPCKFNVSLLDTVRKN